MKYLAKYSSSTAEVYEPVRKLTSPKNKWTWNNIYHKLYKRAKIITKNNATKAFPNEKDQLYTETYALVIGLGAMLLQLTDGM